MRPLEAPAGWQRFGDEWRSSSGARLSREVTQDGPFGSSWALYTLHDRQNTPLARGRDPFALMRRLSELAVERKPWSCLVCGAGVVKPSVPMDIRACGTACASCGEVLTPDEETEAL